MYCVYKHYNPINHKVYIGQTKKSNPNDRWQSGQGYQKNPAFFDDIIKYGWDNFIHEILAQGLTKEEADKLESYYIKLIFQSLAIIETKATDREQRRSRWPTQIAEGV